MIGFWIAAVALLLVAYAFFAPLLLGKTRHSAVDRRRLNLMLHRQRREELARELDGEALENMQAELDKDLLGDLTAAEHAAVPQENKGRATLIAGLVVAPLLALTLYHMLGRPELADFRAEPQAVQESRSDDGFEQMIDRLASRLEKETKDVKGWLLLGRSYQETQRFDKAVAAYEKALAIEPDNLDIQGYYAESLASANDGDYQGKPAEIAAEMLQKNPKHPGGLWIAAAASAQGGDKPKAIAYLETLRGLYPADSQNAQHLAKIVAQVKGEAVPEEAAQAQAETGEGGKSIRVRVTLSDTLKSEANPEDTVFVFARAASGPPMPLAIVRKKVKDLPLEVTLDDSMSMMQGMNLSAFDQLVIGARVSKSGQALPQPGDLQGLTPPIVAENGKTYAVEIGETVNGQTAAKAPVPAQPQPRPQVQAQPQAPAQPSAGKSGKSIQVNVSLADALKAKADPEETVFVFARAASGPPMPLAIVRKKVKDLPLSIMLDDSMSMMQGMNLSAFDQLIIGARVSKSGQALPQPGDLQGLTPPTVAENGKAYAVEIREEIQ